VASKAAAKSPPEIPESLPLVGDVPPFPPLPTVIVYDVPLLKTIGESAFIGVSKEILVPPAPPPEP
jgi:hypothetical protein